jgi:hypothetical protein
MSSPIRPRQSGVRVFWSLLEAIEKSTQMETQALAEKDLASLQILQNAKRADFARLVALGKRLGMSREEGVLDARLRALEAAERRNAELARRSALQIMEEIRSISSGQRQLRSLKQAYAGDSEQRPTIAEG